MHSNCADVKRILGVETCKESRETYNLLNEIVQVGYSTKDCETAYGKKWDVPIGTVTSVVISFKNLKKPSDFDIDLKKCKKTDDTSDAFKETLYKCEDYGTTLNVVEVDEGEFVSTVIYRPTPKDYSCLLCKQ